MGQSTHYVYTTAINFTYQAYEGELSFATDTWTSPNHKSFVAITIHLACEGKPLAMILNIVDMEKICQIVLIRDMA